MSVRCIENATKKEIDRLFMEERIIPKEISRLLHVSYTSVYALTYGKARGYCSCTEYNLFLARRRQREPKYRALKWIVKTRLHALRKNQNWLAAEMGISRQMVSNYAHGNDLPRGEHTKEFFRALKTPFNSLDELVALWEAQRYRNSHIARM